MLLKCALIPLAMLLLLGSDVSAQLLPPMQDAFLDACADPDAPLCFIRNPEYNDDQNNNNFGAPGGGGNAGPAYLFVYPFYLCYCIPEGTFFMPPPTPIGGGTDTMFTCPGAATSQSVGSGYALPATPRDPLPPGYHAVGAEGGGITDSCNAEASGRYSRLIDENNVDISTGEYTTSFSYLRTPGQGLDYQFTLTYRSGPTSLGTSSFVGMGWGHDYFDRLLPWHECVQVDPSTGDMLNFGEHSGIMRVAGNHVEHYLTDSGNPNLYHQVNEGYNRISVQRGSHGVVTNIRLRTPGGTIYRYSPFDGTSNGGLLQDITDRHGNKITLIYEEADYTHPAVTPAILAPGHPSLLVTRLKTVIDTYGRQFEYQYFGTGHDSEGMLQSVTDFLGRSVELAYTSPPSATSPDWPATEALYSGPDVLLETITPPAVTTGPVDNQYPNGKKLKFVYSAYQQIYLLAASHGGGNEGGLPGETSLGSIVGSGGSTPLSSFFHPNASSGTSLPEVRHRATVMRLSRIVGADGIGSGDQGADVPFVRVRYDTQAPGRVTEVFYGNQEAWEDYQAQYAAEVCGQTAPESGSQPSQSFRDLQMDIGVDVRGGMVTYQTRTWPTQVPCTGGASKPIAIGRGDDAVVISRTDAQGGHRNYVLDPGGRVKVIIETNGRVWGASGEIASSLGGNHLQAPEEMSNWVESGQVDCEQPCVWGEVFEYNRKGQLILHLKPKGNVETWEYDALGNNTRHQIWPGHGVNSEEVDTLWSGPEDFWQIIPSGAPLTTERIYDPVYSTLVRETDPRDQSVDGGLGWTPPYGADLAGRYRTTHILDYQESNGPSAKIQSLVAAFGLVSPSTVLGFFKTDVNANGTLNQDFGDIVRTIHPAPSHPTPSGWAHAGLAVTEEFAYLNSGQLDHYVSPEGAVTVYSYFDPDDPDGDGSPTVPPSGWTFSGAGYVEWKKEDAATVVVPGKTVLRPGAGPSGAPAARSTFYEYDAAGNVTAMTDALEIPGQGARRWSWSYNELNEKWQEIGPAPFSYETIYRYDLFGNVCEEERIYRETDSEGNPTTPPYAPMIDLTGVGTVAAPYSFAVGREYDFVGNLVEQSEGYRVSAGVTPVWLRTHRWAYNLENKIQQEVDAEGHVTDYMYDARDRLHMKVAGNDPPGGAPDYPGHWGVGWFPIPIHNPESAQSFYGYDLNGNLVCETDPGGHTTIHVYDDYDRRIQTIRPHGTIETLTLDPASNVYERVIAGACMPDSSPSNFPPTLESGELSRERFIHDELGRLVRTEADLFAPGANPTVTDVAVTSSYFDRSGSVVRVVDPRGNATRTAYDALGRLIRTATAPVDGATGDPFAVAWATTTFLYDVVDRLVETIRTERREDAGAPVVDKELVRTNVYDSLDRLILTVDSLGHATRSSYDSRGLVLEASDSLGATPGSSSFLRIGSGQLVVINDPGNVTRTKYDILGRAARVTRVMTNTGTGDGTPASREFSGPTHPSGTVETADTHGFEISTAVRYDLLDNVIARIADDGAITEFEYDRLSRVVRIEHSDSGEELFVYDDDGLLIEHTDQNGTVRTHTYDEGHRRIATSVLCAPPVLWTGIQGIEMAYDGLDRLVGSKDGNDPDNANDTHHAYSVFDSLGRLVREVQDGRSVLSAYDIGGNKTQIEYDSGFAVQVEFDELSRPVEIVENGLPVASYRYAGALPRVLSRGLQGSVATQYAYDAANRRVGFEHDIPGSGTIDHFEFELRLDRRGSRTHEIEHHGASPKARLFSYDSGNRLIRETRDADWDPILETATGGETRDFYLDGVGNWIFVQDSGQWAHANAVDDLHAYERFGGELHFRDAAGNRTEAGDHEYHYDGLHRLVAVRDSSGTLVEFRYFADGRRALKRDYVSGETTEYLYDGLRVAERLTGTEVVSAVYGLSPWHAIRYTSENGSTIRSYSILEDAIGSAVALVDEFDQVVERYRYTAYGEVEFLDGDGVPTGAPDSAFGNEFLFAGYQYDSASGLYWLRARYYDPASGRFVSVDPIGVWGDAGNWGNGFGYAGCNPLSFVDPLGLGFWSGLRDFAAGAIDGAISGATFGLVETTVGADLLGADTSSLSYTAGNVVGNVAGGVASAAATGGAGALGTVARVASTAGKVKDLVDAAEAGSNIIEAGLNGEAPDLGDVASLAGSGLGGRGNAKGPRGDKSPPKKVEKREGSAEKPDEAGGAPSGGTYKLKDEEGNVVRTGKTNDLKRREGEHARGKDTEDLKFEEDIRSDDPAVRAGREQRIYDQHPEAKAENGGLNKRKPIGDRNPRRQEYLDAEEARAAEAGEG